MATRRSEVREVDLDMRPTWVEVGGRLVLGSILDFSPSGFRIVTDPGVAIEVGDRVQLRLSDEIVAAEVRWFRELPSRGLLFGVVRI